MEAGITLGGLTASILVIFVLWYHKRKDTEKRIHEWTSAVSEMGLADVQSKSSLKPWIIARGEGIWLEVKQDDSYEDTCIVIGAPDLFPQRLELRAETALAKVVSGPDVEVGDEEFDRKVLVRGHPVLAAALLDVDARRKIAELVGHGCQIRGGRLVVSLPLILRNRDQFLATVGGLLDLVRSLSNPSNPAILLASNVRIDPLPKVRLRNLELLLERFPRRSETTDVLLEAVADQAVEVRLRAAAALGEKGRSTLLEIVEDPASGDEIRADALLTLAPDLPVAKIIDILAEGSRNRSRSLTTAAISFLGQIGGEVAINKLCALLEGPDQESAATAARSLGEVGSSAVEKNLIDALDHPDPAVRLAVVGALGDVATVTAVAPLHAAMSSTSDRELRRALPRAVAAIQARISGAEPGQLSLASAAEAGQVTLVVDDGQGQLSLSEEQ